MQNYAESNTTSSQTPSGGAGFKIDWAKLVERSKAVLFNPKEIWPTIKAEETSVKELYLNWILVMAALPVVFGFLGANIFGFGLLKVKFFGSLGFYLSQYVMSLCMVYLFALVMEKLAPNFGGSTNLISTLKLLAYSYTAVYVAGITTIQPMIGGLVTLVAAVYGLYTLWHGIPVMTGVPSEKRLPYFAVCIVASIVVGVIVGLVFAMVTPELYDLSAITTSAGDIDLEKLGESMKELQKLIPNAGQ